MRPGREAAALLVVLGGVAAALHVGKLAPALPVLQQELGISLVEAGFLLSMVQVGGMTLGLVAGLSADSLGLKRTMLAGLLLTGIASVLGGWATTAIEMLALRALEGVGFLLASVPAPGLIRRLVPAERTARMLGLWGAYMPFATAAALLLGPAFIALSGWPGWWWLLGAFSLLMTVVLAKVLPADASARVAGSDLVDRVKSTLGSRGPWLVSFGFFLYSGQWLAVIGFLPTIYLAAGVHPAATAAATTLAAAVNMVGNIASGRLLQRGVAAPVLLGVGYATMGVGGVLAFSPLLGDSEAAAIGRYVAVLCFSMVGGVVPGTLFSLAVRLAPSEQTVSTTVGWMQQLSALGQFMGPPLVAWVAARAGGWQWSWLVTGACALAGLLVAGWSARVAVRRAH